MGNKPSEIIPVPKQNELKAGVRPWPRRIKVIDDQVGARLVERYEIELRGYADAELTVRLLSCDAPARGYELHFEEASVAVRGAKPEDFLYALETLKQIASSGILPTGVLRDWPTLVWRGFHLNFEAYRRLGIDEAVRFVRTAAQFKLNALLVEYGPRFPFENHSYIRDAAALRAEDIERLRETARDVGIELIPLQQSIAHLDYALKHSELTHLRERAEKANLLCPAHPESLELFKTLAREVMTLHPDAKHFHIGGDEARKIGVCSRCLPVAKRDGVGALYGRYIGEAARWVLEQGLRPIVWDDTLCAYPAAFEYLPKETIIQYWDYIAVADPTPVLIPRMAHIDGAPRVCHHWRWALPNKAGRLSDVQRDVMKNYSQAARLKSALGKPYLDEFGHYLGSGFPRWIKALPYLEYYRDRGHDVITSPTGLGNGDTVDGVPNFIRFQHNIRTHAQRCAESGASLGMITTAWYNMPPELLYQPMILTAQCAW